MRVLSCNLAVLIISNILFASSVLSSLSSSLVLAINNNDDVTMARRNLQEQGGLSYYYVTSTDDALLPRNKYDNNLGNPMKGLCPNPDWISYNDWTTQLPASLGDYKLRLNSFMLADPDIVGNETAYNWTWFENKLNDAAVHGIHAIIRFIIHWPGDAFSIPSYLLHPSYNLTFLNNNSDIYYDNPALKRAIQQCVTALGNRYDGDPRIYAFQGGFLGYWGEHHTFGCQYTNGQSCLPKSVVEELIQWYAVSFSKTHIQFRYPEYVNANNNGFGYHDDSFTYYTLNGTYNGGSNRDSQWFFWNMAIMNNVSSFWRYAPMGGEVRPENDIVFTDTYPAGTETKQEFNACTEVTHASFMLWSRGWHANSYTGVVGTELQRARNASARMGYSLEISQIAVAAPLLSTPPVVVTIDVSIQQTGVAPFYYPLNLTLFCLNGSTKLSTTAVATGALAQRDDTTIVRLQNVPVVSQTCFNAIEFRLESMYLYSSRPIKWSQGNNNGTIILAIPLPPPSDAPTKVPITTRKPTQVPRKPTNAPRKPTLRPTNKPKRKN